MKTWKTRLGMFVMFTVLTFGVLIPGTRTEAATLTNVLKAPVAAKGKWNNDDNGKRYVFSYSGKYAKKQWLKIKGKIYYFTNNGYVKKGFFKYNGRYYYLGETTGKLVTGWKTIKGKRYYFWKAANKGELAGSAAVGKVKISSKYYYFNSKGVRQSGWIKIDDYYYYFLKSNGVMAKNTTIDGYKIDKYGRRVEAEQTSVVSDDAKTGKVDFWVGDSRTVGLANVMKLGKDDYIAKVGEGYSWYISTAEANLQAKLKKKPTATVVINLGVNDITNYSKYITRYKKLLNNYPKARIFFMSVNPINTKLYTAGYVTDKQIRAFNSKIKAAFPDQYIDTYTYMKNNGFGTVDGLHYTTATYKKIYNYVIGKV